MFCVQLTGKMKETASPPLLKVYAKQRKEMMQTYNLEDMELMFNDRTLQVQILFFIAEEVQVEPFVQEQLFLALGEMNQLIEEDKHVIISQVTA
ncbi:hypothetical protein ACQZV8_10100 [Magnetococcales bacterium HHB-1]